MSAVPSTERLFSLSCFEGLKMLRRYAEAEPELGPAELLKLVIKVEADALSLDMEAAVHLYHSVAQECPLDGELFYQGCIKAVVITHQPIWSKSMRQGRLRFVDSLGKDERDAFAAAGLLRTPPTTLVVSWWDEVVGHARLAIDTEKMHQARKAEKLTIEHEKRRLRRLGISRSPEWTGLDDNYAGYDVLSYDLIGEHEVTRMIEVKSTVASPLRFYLSRNEWNKANDVGDRYFFHVWDMAADPPNLYEFSVDQVRPHIPLDNAKGKWTTSEIPVGSLNI